MRKLAYILVSLVLFSCGKSNQENSESEENTQLRRENELVITADGDSLEDGYWKYNDEVSGLSKEGKYRVGVKTGEWKYKIFNKEKTVEWMYFDKQRVKFNYPKYLEISNAIEYPTLFIGDIIDSNNKTYIALLEYDLKDMNSSVYDYLYQVNEAFTSDTSKIIKGKSFRKYIFKNIELFTVNIQLEQDGETYNIMSQVFEINGYLYDFTYKDIAKRMSIVNLEIFKDMLYSMESNGVDLFTYNTGQYLQDEDVVFE